MEAKVHGGGGRGLDHLHREEQKGPAGLAGRPVGGILVSLESKSAVSVEFICLL